MPRRLHLVLGLCLAACGSEAGTAPSGSASAVPPSMEASGSARPAGSGKPTDAATPTLSAKADAPRPADVPAGDVQPEMKAFLAMLDGSDDCVPKALKKFGHGTLDDKDMSMYMLREARVIKVDKKSDKLRCYDFEAKGGSVTYGFEGVCWEGRKIVSVERERPEQ